MLFKSKNDQKSIERAQKMYGPGINRGLAGFVGLQNKKKKHVKEQSTTNEEEIVLTTTEIISENDYRIIGAVFGTAKQSATGSAHQAALDALKKSAKQVGADVVVSMRFDSSDSTVTAYGTAVKLVK